MKKNELPEELQARIRQVELDNSCDCDQYEVPKDRVADDVDMINLDENTRERG